MRNRKARHGGKLARSPRRKSVANRPNRQRGSRVERRWDQQSRRLADGDRDDPGPWDDPDR